MSEQSTNRCVVLLPAGDSRFARLFDELFAQAIIEAGLAPYRIHQSPAEQPPIDRLVREIAKADVVFADLSQNNDEIWFALGCALALNKQLCLTSSTLDFSLPLDLQDLEIIPYPETPFPRDYSELKQSITHQLLAKRPNPIALQPVQPLPSTLPVAPAPAPVAPPPEDVFANTPLSADLTSHEILALTLIDTHASSEGLSPRDLGREMQANDSAHLTSHAMNSLKRRKFIERRPVSVADGTECYVSDNLFITWSGKNWLLQHGKRGHAMRSNATPSEFFMAAR